MPESKLELDNGKYTVIYNFNPKRGERCTFRALRGGEEWRDLSGDSLVFHLVSLVEEQEAEISRLREALLDSQIA